MQAALAILLGAGLVVQQQPQQQDASSSGGTATEAPGGLSSIFGRAQDTIAGPGLGAAELGLQGAQNLQGLPGFVRFQTLGLIIQVQQIPVLDPGYWKYVVGDPYDLSRS